MRVSTCQFLVEGSLKKKVIVHLTCMPPRGKNGNIFHMDFYFHVLHAKAFPFLSLFSLVTNPPFMFPPLGTGAVGLGCSTVELWVLMVCN